MDVKEDILKIIIKYGKYVETITSTKKIQLEQLKNIITKKFKIDEFKDKNLTFNFYDKENDYNTIKTTDDIYNNLTQQSEHTYSIELFLSFPIHQSITISPEELAQTHQDLKQSEFNIDKKLKEELNEQEQSKLNAIHLRENEIKDLNNKLKKQKQIFEKNKNDLTKEKEDFIENIKLKHQKTINSIKKQIQEIKISQQKDNNFINNNDMNKFIKSNIIQNINSFIKKFIGKINNLYIRKIEEFIKVANIKFDIIRNNIEEINKINNSSFEKNKIELNNHILLLKKQINNMSKYINNFTNKKHVKNKKNEESKNSANICQTVKKKSMIPKNKIRKINLGTNSNLRFNNSNKNIRNNTNDLNNTNSRISGDNIKINSSNIKNESNNLSPKPLKIDSNIYFNNNLKNNSNININSKINSNNDIQKDVNNNNKIMIPLNNDKKNSFKRKNQSCDKNSISQKQEEQTLKVRFIEFLNKQFFSTTNSINPNKLNNDLSVLINFFYEFKKLNLNINNELRQYRQKNIIPLIRNPNSDNILIEKFNNFESIINRQLQSLNLELTNPEDKMNLNTQNYNNRQNSKEIFSSDNRQQNHDGGK